MKQYFRRMLAMCMALVMLSSLAAVAEENWQEENLPGVEETAVNDAGMPAQEGEADPGAEAEATSDAVEEAASGAQEQAVAEAGARELGAEGIAGNEAAAPEVGQEPAPISVEVDPAGKAQTVRVPLDGVLKVSVQSPAMLIDLKPAKTGYVDVAWETDGDGSRRAVVTARKLNKKLKLTLNLEGAKKKKVALNVAIVSQVEKIQFNENLPADIPLGTKLSLADLQSMVSVTPAAARAEYVWKVSGAAKLKKDVLETTKAGKATITVSDKSDKKIKAVATLQVLANKVTINDKPTASAYGDINNGWTLWPGTIEVNKKGLLQCQFYVLNATGSKSAAIENMTLTLAADTPDNVVATYSNIGRKPLKVSVKDKKYKVVKFAMTPAAAFQSVFLPMTRLYFGINQGTVKLAASGKNAERYDFVYCPCFPEPIPVNRIEMDSALKLVLGQSATLKATVFPDDATNPGLLWTSSDETVATVVDGVVTGVKAGSATITVTSREDSRLTAACVVTVVQPVTGLTLTPDSLLMAVGAEQKLEAALAPENASVSTLDWKSSDESVATISEDGVVKALKSGYATITATTKDDSGISATCTVAVIGLSIAQPSLTLGLNRTQTLTATLIPEDAEAGSLSWASSDESVATVSVDGLVTGVAEGQATVTVALKNNASVKAECVVTVKNGDVAGDYVINNGVVTEYLGQGGAIEIPEKTEQGQTVTAIGEGLFKDNAAVTSVRLPSGVTEIRASAFENCAALESVEAPNGVTTIGTAAFKNCGKLKTMTTY